MSSVHKLAVSWFVALVLLGTGCQPDEESAGDRASVEDDAPFVLGDLIEPFEPPTMDDLDSRVEWMPQPVEDSLARLQRRQEDEPLLATVDEALALRNDSPEANDKILSALGRLPEDPDDVDWNATITRHTAADVRSTNPIMGSSTIEFDVSGLTGFGLFGFDWEFNRYAASDTVVSWETSTDRMYDRVVMRDDLTWSDGQPITAHDIVFSYQVIMSSAVPVPAMRSGTDKLRWVEAYDDHTLVFFHQEPMATNQWHVGFGILPRHIYEDSIADDPTLQNSPYHVAYEKAPVTGGAYVLHRRVLGREIILRRRESWYLHEGRQVRDRPFFEEIRFQIIPESSVALLAVKAGDIEEKILGPEEWVTKTDGPDFYRNNTKAYGLEWVYFHFMWNNRTEFFSDPRVRRAMSYAFDHQEMHEILLYGLAEPCNGIFHPTSRWAPEDPPPAYQQDLDKAEQLLDEAGWIDTTGDGIRNKEIEGRQRRFEFSILVVNAAERIAICNLLQQNLAQIGIICHVRPLEFTVLQEKTLQGHFHASFGGWGTGAYPDTNENIWRSDGGRNYVGYSNPEVDALFDQALTELDETKREELFGRIHLLLYEDQPYTWLFFRNSFYAFNKRLRGYNFSPRGPFNYGPGFGSIWKPAL